MPTLQNHTGLPFITNIHNSTKQNWDSSCVQRKWGASNTCGSIGCFFRWTFRAVRILSSDTMEPFQNSTKQFYFVNVVPPHHCVVGGICINERHLYQRLSMTQLGYVGHNNTWSRSNNQQLIYQIERVKENANTGIFEDITLTESGHRNYNAIWMKSGLT